MNLPEKKNSVCPHLTVRNVEAAARFYETAFGFKIKFMMPGKSGTIMHAEVEHNESTIMIGPESKDRGMLAPQTIGVISPVSIYVLVGDVDAQHQVAINAGGRELLEPTDQFFGARTSIVMDPDGHQWMLAQEEKQMTVEAMEDAIKAARTGVVRGHIATQPKAAPATPDTAKK